MPSNRVPHMHLLYPTVLLPYSAVTCLAKSRMYCTKQNTVPTTLQSEKSSADVA